MNGGDPGHDERGLWPMIRDYLLQFRPLDPVRSIKVKLIIIIGASVFFYMVIVWVGVRFDFGLLKTFPFALLGALVLTQILARGMTRPLRDMTAAARTMARGDYSIRVHTKSQDEVGQLAEAFNSMASDLSQLDTQRKEMVANVSHELRTPVAALRAQLENMADGVVEPDEEALQASLGQIERLSGLIDYLLDLSRLEAGAAALDVAVFHAHPFLEDVVAEARDAATERSLRWEVVVDPVSLRLRADSERLRQVLTNLLANAARHSPSGGRIRVSLTRGSEPGSVHIDVLDEGDGIPAADRDKVFARFERGNTHSLTGRSTGGTGLGLAIARWAVELHHGSIVVLEPPSDRGTLIRVTLPTQPVPHQP